jgi:hypothetical protein
MAISEAWLKAQLGKDREKIEEFADRDAMSVRITPKGKIVFQLRYRYNGKQHRLDLGSYPNLTLKNARLESDRLRAELEKGLDPKQVRLKEKVSIRDAYTLETLFYEWYEKFCVPNKSSHNEIKRSFEIYVLPAIGKQNSDDISAYQWLSLLEDVAKKSPSISARLLINANQCLKWGQKRESFIKEHFPTLYARLLELGIDITKEMIPVVPAAHYTCGGVVVDEHSQTDIAGLYAIGETSYTGLHGANRMASNSLLECFVYGMSAAEHIEKSFDITYQSPTAPSWDDSQVMNPDEDVVILQNWDELRQTMWNYVGIVRTTKRLERALHRIEMLKREITEYYQDYQVSKNLIELRNLVLVSEMIVRCAMERKESRGLHYTLDYPELSNELRKTVLTPLNFKVETPLVNN